MGRIVRTIIATGLIAVLVLSLAAGLSGLIWQSEMIAPFRLQFCVAAAVGLGLSVLLKRRSLILLSVVVCIGATAPVAWRLTAQHRLPASAPGTPVRLVFSNVLCDNHDYGRVLDLVRTEQPDLFVAAETTPEWFDNLAPLQADYPYSFTPPDLDIFGIAVYARKPFKAELLRVGRHRLPLARLEFANYVLLVAHPLPPRHKTTTLENRQYIDTLASLAQTTTKPVIIAGDLNSTLWSHNMRPLMTMQWPAGSGLAYSWPSDKPHMAIQIDHVLTKGAIAGRYRVLPRVGSDHFPVRADLVLPSRR